MAAVLAYADLLADDSNYGRYTLLPYSLHTHMRLDATALRALNVTESKTDGNRNFCLMGLMNRTCTAGMGKRLLNRWLKQPLVDEEEIKFRLDVVQSFVESGGMRQEVRGHLRRMPDIERLTRRLEMRRAGLQDVVKLYQASIRLPFIREVLETHGGSFRPMLHERFGASLLEWCRAEHLAKYEGLVEAAVDLDALQSNGEYLIAPGYDPSLGEIKEEREGVEAEVQKALQQAANDLGLVVDKTIKLDKTAQAGYCYRITKKEETNVRKKLNSSYVTLETRKDGVKFTNVKLRRLSERHVALTDSYMAAQRELVNKVVEVAQTFLEVFEGVAALIAEMDVLQGFAELAASAPTPYVRPSISGPEEGDIVLEDSRHPCVEVQDDVSFIPNHCRLERGRSWFQIITGPNMGGKSTFIRQVGVVVLMAQVGSFVPCSRAHVSIRDAIFARVGAGDCQLRGVSTFMAEMLETAAILHAATPHSLVIIDELGRGTSTYDGFGLAWAICEHLVDVTKAPTLFATHFHELTALETRDASSGVANFHVSAHIDEASRKLTMLYKVQPGPCDQSFGIHVAEFAHFPAEMRRVSVFGIMAFTPARVLLLAFLAAMVAIAYCDHDHDEDVDTFKSKLLGANEVPKNDSQAARNAVGDQRGVVYMKLSIYKDDDKPKWVKYTVKTSRLKGEMPPTKTHVHKGEKGKNGDVILDLPCKYEKKGGEEWRCEGSLGKNEEDRSDSLLSALKAIVKKPSGYYGNIHTKRFPDGAVRGQFAKD
ncbi:unnamed protein product [Closterium sp. Yama58-4]|nr:unnamed protein product [Closterium sp. Yama58-4]